MNGLLQELERDLVSVGIHDRVPIVLKNYSKSRWGRYDPNKDIIIVYVYKDKSMQERIEYGRLFSTLLHECCHWIQHHDKNYRRKKGVMHNEDFWKMYRSFLRFAVERGILDEQEVSEV